MTTNDLRDKTVEELLEMGHDEERAPGGGLFVAAGRELARRLAEAQQQIAERDAMLAVSVKEMVDRFLAWKLPDDFYPDGGIKFDRLGNHWPIGTNLFTAEQAKQMFNHCLPATAKANAEILRAAKEHFEYENSVESDPPYLIHKCDCEICQAVRAAKEIR